jgi:hypothetical protein
MKEHGIFGSTWQHDRSQNPKEWKISDHVESQGSQKKGARLKIVHVEIIIKEGIHKFKVTRYKHIVIW